MGWGNPPHEGFAGARQPDGSLAPEIEEGGVDEFVSACECGWEGGSYPPTEEGRQACFEDWLETHFGPIVSPDPSRVLIRGHDGAGRRYYLAGRPVHAGTRLELLLSRGRWLPIRFHLDQQFNPRGAVSLGGPWEGIRMRCETTFALPEGASLRWPDERQQSD